ncbi:hypothetical protein LCGC14_1676480 [marine sediment metagenome]|uniref:DNRLRE domain-containing protein n=1 Tax=marine sediment metagenome TaxID=412755 RepID=A0A0F9HQG2_9ZZZZ
MVQDGRHRKPLQRSSGGGGGGLQTVLRFTVSDWAEIRDTSPNTNFNKPNPTAVVAIIGTTVLDFRGLFRWDTAPIDLSAFAPGFFKETLGIIVKDFFPKIFLQPNSVAGTFHAEFRVATITADFDPSTVTWNTAPAFSDIYKFVFENSGALGKITITAASGLHFYRPSVGPVDKRWAMTDGNGDPWDGSYGFMVYATSLSMTGFTRFEAAMNLNTNPSTVPLSGTHLTLYELP